MFDRTRVGEVLKLLSNLDPVETAKGFGVG